MRELILLTILIFGIGAIGARAQSAVEITFDGGAKLSVLDSYLDEGKNKIESIVEETFTAEYYSVRKANYALGNDTLRLLNAKNSSLARQIARINSAYEIKQGGEAYGFGAFNSVDYGQFKNCAGSSVPCRIKCRAVIITIDTGGEKKNILVIKSIVKLK